MNGALLEDNDLAYRVRLTARYTGRMITKGWDRYCILIKGNITNFLGSGGLSKEELRLTKNHVLHAVVTDLSRLRI